MVASGVAGFADELIASGTLPHLARARAQASYEDAFPGGEPAAGHLVFALREDDRAVGWLWLGPAIDEAPGYEPTSIRMRKAISGSGEPAPRPDRRSR